MKIAQGTCTSHSQYLESCWQDTPWCAEIMGALFYSQAVDKVVPVNSTTVAEIVKLLESTFRMINIGLANEIATLCDRMGINVWEVIDAAATSPLD